MPGFHAVEGSSGMAFVSDDPLISDRDVATARAIPNPGGPATVELTWTPEGRRRFADATREHRGEVLALVIDGELVTMMTFDEAVDEPSVQMSKGESGTLAEAAAFALRFIRR